MPRYHLHLRGGWQDQDDATGVELPDALSAEHVALAAARELLRTAVYADENIEAQQWFEIVDGAGALQAIIPVQAALYDFPSVAQASASATSTENARSRSQHFLSNPG